MSLCASVYMCFVVTCWERADLLALVCGVCCEFVTFPLVSWVRCGTWLYRFLIFAPLFTLLWWTVKTLMKLRIRQHFYRVCIFSMIKTTCRDAQNYPKHHNLWPHTTQNELSHTICINIFWENLSSRNGLTAHQIIQRWFVFQSSSSGTKTSMPP